jgi:hypothetical protein
MNAKALLFTFIVALSAVADAPTEMRNAAHCVVAGDRHWLQPPLTELDQLKVAFVRDHTSYPGEFHLVIIFLASRSSGQVFDLKEQRTKDLTRFSVENNGSFRVSDGKVAFVDPPLGGVWTQEHLASDIKRALANTHYEISRRSLERVRGISCTSYVDEEKRDSLN